MSSCAVLTLGREPNAAAHARDFVTDRAAEWQLDGQHDLDTVVLLASELVTNAILHTQSPITLRLLAEADLVRVEVDDGSSVLPVPGVLNTTAMSGRGLMLVQKMSRRWGVRQAPEQGKTVWFELATDQPESRAEPSVEELLDMWDPGEELGPPTPEIRQDLDRGDSPVEPTVLIRIPGIPTPLLNGAKSHLDDLLRDLNLVLEGAESGAQTDRTLLALAYRLTHAAAGVMEFRNQIRRQAVAATHRHAETLDLEVELPVSLRDRLVDYRDALDEADDFCVAGRLLVTPAPPEHVEFRRWKLNRIISHLTSQE